MSKTVRTGGARARAALCGAALLLSYAVASLVPDGSQAGARIAAAHAKSWVQGAGRVEVRLRSFVPNASGQLTVEASAEGGRGRLTALSLPPPESQSRAATTYVVWANSGGRIKRLGELRRDERGNGGLAFEHPAPFERYTVIVTAEPNADAERPAGAPVLSTRANEIAALFPADTPETTAAAATQPAESAPAANSNSSPPDETTTPTANTNVSAPADAPSTTTAATTTRERAPRRESARRLNGDFYTEVDDALDAAGGGRALVFDGGELAPRASGRARAAQRTGSAYIVARLSDVPLPDDIGANTYVLWAVLPDGRIVYMGSLPSDSTLNRADVYVRVGGFDSDAFDLAVTAEQRRPVPSPSDRRALSTRRSR